MNTTELDRLLIKQCWERENCPYFDLIMHADGKIFPLQEIAGDDSGVRQMNSNSWLPISQVPNIDDENKLNEGFASIFSMDYCEMNLRASCGECFSSGENGFISISNLLSGDLLWLAFFVASNPFYSVTIKNGSVIAQSTDGRIFTLDLENPTRVQIV